MSNQKTGHGGARKFGRDKIKCASYRANHIREKAKLKHILRSSMLAEATRYAKLHNLTGYLASLTT